MAKEEEKLSAAQRSKIRRLSQPKELAADEEGGELNIVPFLDIIMNVLMFVLATVPSRSRRRSTRFRQAQAGGSARPRRRRPSASRSSSSGDGLQPEGARRQRRAGLQRDGLGARGRRRSGGDYDYTALNACVEQAEAASPEFAEETQVTITANPNIPYQVVISAMDAVRARTDTEKSSSPT